MKSKKAQELLDRKVYHDNQIEDECVLYSWAIEAVELAEAEMWERASEAHRNRCQTCAVSTHERICGDRRRVKSVADFGIVCDDKCSYMQDFLAALDNDKPIKTE